MKADRPDLSAEEIWRTSMLLRRVEIVFRGMKNPRQRKAANDEKNIKL